MSKRASVVFQVNEVLRDAFHEGFGRSRHVDKQNAMNNGEQYDKYTKDKIYNDKTYKATNKTCVAFAKFCREEYGIKYISEIKPEMFKGFIEKGDFKTGTPYDPKTAGTYASQVTKLQNAYNSKNGTNVAFIDNSYREVVGEKEHKRDQMPREMHDKIIQKCYESKYTNGLAFDTARALGLRVREITNIRKEDFRFNDKGEFEKVHIHRSKGGRSRDVEASKLTSEQVRSVLKTYDYFKDKTADHDRFFTNKAQSYEKAFSRSRDAVGSGYTHCGVHSMRKEFAKDYYNREIEKGREDIEVRRELTELLGHNRLEVLSAYLK